MTIDRENELQKDLEELHDLFRDSEVDSLRLQYIVAEDVKKIGAEIRVFDPETDSVFYSNCFFECEAVDFKKNLLSFIVNVEGQSASVIEQKILDKIDKISARHL